MNLRLSLKKVGLSILILGLASQSLVSRAGDGYCAPGEQWFKTLIFKSPGDCTAQVVRFGCNDGSYSEFSYFIRLSKCV